MIKKIIVAVLTFCMVLALPLSGQASQETPDFEELVAELEAEELVVVSPRSEELSNYLDTLMEELFELELQRRLEELGDEADDEALTLTTYDKAIICYDYLIDTVRYGSHVANMNATVGKTTCRSIYNAYGEVEGFGAVALTAKTGMCNAYASAFIMMARKLGLDAYLVKGSTRSGRGGYAYHEWAEIELEGQVFVFDPQLDQSLENQGLGSRIIFGRTYAEIPGRYAKI